jgi:integrase/recombinase XerC
LRTWILRAGPSPSWGKGRTEKTRLTLPSETQDALRGWLSVRGDEPGALFLNFDRAGKGKRLTGKGVYNTVRRLGADLGLKTWPHGLRHAAITEALDLTGGDVRKVQRFSRHRDLQTLTIYDDNRVDLAGEVSKLVASNGGTREDGTAL